MNKVGILMILATPNCV